MTREKAQELYNKGYAIDVLNPAGWQRCLGLHPSDWTQPITFRKGHAKLKVKNQHAITKNYDNCLPLSKWEKARLGKNDEFRPKDVMVGDMFYVETPNSDTKRGEIVTLTEDDGTSCPFFKTKTRNYSSVLFWRLYPVSRVPRKDEKKPKHMSVSEFIRRKNKILRDFLGMPFDLVPEDQIEEVEQTRLSMATATESCPYCMACKTTSGFTNCSKCIMDSKGNSCQDPSGTWSLYLKLCEDTEMIIHTDPRSQAYEPMKKLIDEYNAGLSAKPSKKKPKITFDEDLKEKLQTLNLWKKVLMYTKQNYKDKTAEYHIKSIREAFIWRGTKEGCTFWDMVSTFVSE